MPEDVKRERLERLTELQRAITAERYEAARRAARARAGGGAGERRGRGAGAARARLPWQADDIDGVTWLDTDVPAGAFAEVEVTGRGRRLRFLGDACWRVVDAPPAVVRTVSIAIVARGPIGSFGR